jgi:hypothetical protein
MPHKHNAGGRHHIPTMLHAVTNWPQYEAGLRRRGCLTLWITQEAIEPWAATRRSTPGGQAVYRQATGGSWPVAGIPGRQLQSCSGQSRVAVDVTPKSPFNVGTAIGLP